MKAWEELLITLEKQLGVDTVSKWLRPIKVVKFDAGNLYLEATHFQKNWFEEHIRPRISGIFRNNNHRPIRIHWDILGKRNALNGANDRSTIPDISFETPLEEAYLLETFLPFQPVALGVVRELLASGGRCDFNPLLFFGPTGCGKTHLLMGVAAALKGLKKRACYMQADRFTEHVVQSIRLGNMHPLRKILRDLDVFLFDDVQLLARKFSTQEEFFHTFNALHTAGKQIILSASQAPGLLEGVEPRLVSRFEWGVAIPLLAHTEDQLKRIVEQKVERLSVVNKPLLVEFLLSRFRSTPRAPMDALYTLSLRNPKQIDLGRIENTLSDLLKRESIAAITPEKIMKQTASYFGVLTADLAGKSQLRSHVIPRKVALFLCRSLLHLPYQTLGRLFHRDHSTVMTSIAQVEHALEKRTSPITEAVETLTKALRRSTPPL